VALNRIAGWFNRLTEEDRPEDGPDETQLGAAALLVEAAHLDGDFSPDERHAIEAALARHFDLSDEEVGALMDAAEQAHGDAVEISRFTRAIKQLPPPQRIEIMEMLWEVVLADGDLHAYEANLLRRVGGLIYVSDRENGEARQRVLARLG
jgi:uncharacterized tellurite resistance protein B-like protein